MPKFSDIPLFPHSSYAVDIGWDYLEEWVQRAIKEDGLNLEPDFQRAHVWTEAQQTAYIEYMLKGGEVARSITFNHPGWHDGTPGEYVIIDGKQRLEAIRKFMRSELPIFGGNYRNDYTGHLRIFTGTINWRICCLKKRSDILQLYLNINAGGTPHTGEEIGKVAAMYGLALDKGE